MQLLKVLLHDLQDFGRRRWGQFITGLQEMTDFPEYPGIPLRRPSHHQTLSAREVQDLSGSLRRVDVAVCKDRYVHFPADFTDCVVLGFTFETIGTGPSMHGKGRDSGRLCNMRNLNAVTVDGTRARANLERDRHIDSADYCVENTLHQLGVRQKSGTRQLVADLLGGTTHIDVNDLGATGNIVTGCIGHPLGVTACDLHSHRIGLTLEIASHPGFSGIPQRGVCSQHLRHDITGTQFSAQLAEKSVRDAYHGRQCQGVRDVVRTDEHVRRARRKF